MQLVLTLVLAGLLIVVGTVHLIRPSRVEPLVPEWWPRPRATVYVSGVVEILLGAALLIGPTRHGAALVSGVVFVVYAGVHLDDLRHVRRATAFTDRISGVLLRGVVNVLYAGIAFYLAATA